MKHPPYENTVQRAVTHIFGQFLNDISIKALKRAQGVKEGLKVLIKIEGAMKGELALILPTGTIGMIAQKYDTCADNSSINEYHKDIAGEIANQVAGAFINQLIFDDKEIKLFPPEFDTNTKRAKTSQKAINQTYSSSFGKFNIDLNYREMKFL